MPTKIFRWILFHKEFLHQLYSQRAKDAKYKQTKKKHRERERKICIMARAPVISFTAVTYIHIFGCGIPMGMHASTEFNGDDKKRRRKKKKF